METKVLLLLKQNIVIYLLAMCHYQRNTAARLGRTFGISQSFKILFQAKKSL